MTISTITSKEIFFVALTFVLGFFFMTMPYFGMDFSTLPGDLGDTRFNIFILEHAKQFVGGEVENGYWNAYFMYPEAEVISLSDNLLGSAPFYILFRWLGLDIFSAFQWWVVVLTLLNFTSAYALFRHITSNMYGALLGAFIFAFSIGLSSQLNHAQMIPRFAIPLSLLFLLRWIRYHKADDFGLAVSLLVYQFYCGIYLGFMAVVPFGVIFIAGLVVQFHPLLSTLKRMKNALFYFVIIAVNGLLTYILFAPYMRRAFIFESIGVVIDYKEHIFHSLPSLFSYFSASQTTIIHDWMTETTTNYQAYWDHMIFPGWIALFSFIAISLILVWRFFRKDSRLILENKQQIFVLAGLVCFFVFLRFDDFSLYNYLQNIPGLRAMRSLTRIINVNLLFFGGAFALIIHLLSKRFPKHQILIFAVGMTLLFVDNLQIPSSLVTIEKSYLRERHHKLIEKMQHLEAGTIISYQPEELGEHVVDHHIDAMLAAQELHLKSVNGYSARAPYMYYLYWATPNQESLEFWLSRFENVGPEDVTVIR